MLDRLQEAERVAGLGEVFDRVALEAKYARAAEVSRVNYAFYLGATNDNIDEIRRLDPKAAPGIKVFMGASTGNMLVDDPATLDAIFRDCPTPIITHCEDTPTIAANEDPRKTLAAWMTSPENPYFARAMANWVWSQLFGKGLVDPPDDMSRANPPIHPELLDALARHLVASKYKLPAVYSFQGFVEEGGLMSYGPSDADLFRRAAGYVDRILKGTEPGELPVEQPTKFEPVINLKTAKALGLRVPPSLLARAEEVIE